MEGSCENNSINRMQEHLQAMCPVSGVPPWSYEEQGSFHVRIVLERTGPSGDEAMPMPWSARHSKKMDAKKDAARLCLEALLASGARPHDASQVWITIHENDGGGGGGGGDVSEVAPAAACPTLTDELLAVQPVVCIPVASGGGAGDAEPDSDDDDDDDAMQLQDAMRGASATSSSRCFCSTGYQCWICRQRHEEAPAAPQRSVPPENLGDLGEQWALKWLQRQPWIEPGSVKWLNETTQAPTRDIECVPIGSPGRRQVEVKTRWRRFKKAAATRAQRARLLDPEDDYMLLVVGFFENVLPGDGQPPSPPQVRVLPNLKWQDQQLQCAWQRRATGGSSGSDLFCHASSITDGSCLRDGSKVHFRRSYDAAKGKVSP
jgi:hypothetical protein